MTKKQNNYLNMMAAVFELIDKYPRAWNANLPFKDKIGYMKNMQAEIYDAIYKQKDYSSKGYTLAKEKDCRQLRKMLNVVASRARSYALDSGNMILVAKLKFSTSRINRLSIHRLLVVAQQVEKNIRTELPHLSAYEVNNELLTNLQECIEQARKGYSLRDEVIAEGMEATTRIKSLFKEVRNGFVILDNMVAAFSNIPEFTTTYFYARRIIHSRGKAKVKEENVTVKEVLLDMANS